MLIRSVPMICRYVYYSQKNPPPKTWHTVYWIAGILEIITAALSLAAGDFSSTLCAGTLGIYFLAMVQHATFISGKMLKKPKVKKGYKEKIKHASSKTYN